MTNRWLGDTEVPRGARYDARFAALQQAGHDVHGEATFVAALGGRTVLDAGCGTGRVAIELARRGYDVVGVDIDGTMLASARQKAPQLPWIEGDLSIITLPGLPASPTLRTFDVIVMAGNVMLFLAPGSEAPVVANMARHLAPGGALVAGFQLLPDGLSVQQYDSFAGDAGLSLHERWATWDRQPWHPRSAYAVSVHLAHKL